MGDTMKPKHNNHQQYFNRLGRALDEFNDLADVVRAAGYGYLAKQYEPSTTASLEEIEQATDDLRQCYQARIGINPYVYPTD